MAKGVFCIATTEPQAITIVEQLKTTGFSHDDISVLFPDKTGTRNVVYEQPLKTCEGAAARVSASIVLGGVLHIPGLGPFIAAGPIMAALRGGVAGEAPGGLTGVLLSIGIPKDEAKRYEGKIKNGGTLISVHARDRTEQDIAKGIFEHAGIADISCTEETRTARETQLWRSRSVGPLPAPPGPSGSSLVFSRFFLSQRK